MEITFAVKDLFFDRPAIKAAVDTARRRGLAKIGAFVRRKARTQILRRRKRPSEPGSPPSIHGGEPGLKTIFFAYDQSADSVLVGPVKLNRNQVAVPKLLEFGGQVNTSEVSPDGRYWVPARLGRRFGPKTQTRRRKATYRPRPFMGPALLATVPELPQQLRNVMGPAAVTTGA